MSGTPEPRGCSTVGGILLAAGSSSRLVGPSAHPASAGPAGASSTPTERLPKQLLPFQGRPLVRHVAAQALGSRLASLTVVVGYRAADVTAALAGLNVEIVENPSFAQGQSTSLRAGLLSFRSYLSAALILLVDQPFVSVSLIDRLIGLYEESGAPIVAPRFQGRRGNPVLFDRALLPELLTTVGDIGAREIIAHHRDRLVALELSDDRAFQDVDTWEDFQGILAGSAGESGGSDEPPDSPAEPAS